MTKQIEIDDKLYLELESAAKKQEDSLSVEKYAEQLLQQGLSASNTGVYKPHEEEEIKNRLKALGYID